MTPNPNVPPEVTAYLAAVGEALKDLPAQEREDLLDEVEVSLVETFSESNAPVAARLGPPEEFAAELRSAAGLHGAQPASAGRSHLRRWIRESADKWRVAEARCALAQLRPIWWPIRAYVLVAALALALHSSWSISHPSVPRLGSAELGLAAIAAATALSIWLGLRRPKGQLVALANAALLIAAVPVLAHLGERAPQQIYVSYVPVANAAYPGLTYNGVPVRNIYPVTRDGRLLHDVLLFNEFGTPLEVGRDEVDPTKRILVTRGQNKIFNTFPIRYFERGTARVAHPNAMPRVSIPRISTPPLTTKKG